ncbi:MAG TPA: DNA methyltransferase [Gaiellales bacterium]
MTVGRAGAAEWPARLPTVLRVEGRNTASLPQPFAAEDVRFTEQFVAFFVERLTAPGDAVLDPFAGFGTTPIVAERMGREGWGVEIDAERVAYIRGRAAAPDRILEADARALTTLAVPPITLVVTSPPFSAPGDPLDALGGYRGRNPGYVAYLDGIRDVFRSARALLAPGAWVVIEAADLRRSDEVTQLPRDIAAAVGEVLPFAGEIAVEWEPPLRGDYDRSVCLLFSA